MDTKRQARRNSCIFTRRSYIRSYSTIVLRARQILTGSCLRLHVASVRPRRCCWMGNLHAVYGNRGERASLTRGLKTGGLGIPGLAPSDLVQATDRLSSQDSRSRSCVPADQSGMATPHASLSRRLGPCQGTAPGVPVSLVLAWRCVTRVRYPGAQT